MTVRYMCPHGCGARYASQYAARRCPCTPTPDNNDDDPDGDPVHARQSGEGLELTAGGEAWIAARPRAVVNLEEAY